MVNLKAFLSYIIILFCSSFCYAQIQDGYVNPIKDSDSTYINVLLEGNSYNSWWEKIDSNVNINLLTDQECPQGKWLGIKDGRANIFDYFDEDGSSIDFMFSFEASEDDKHFKGKFIGSNAIVFESDNMNREFKFVLQHYPEDGNVLILISEDKKIVKYKKFVPKRR